MKANIGTTDKIIRMIIALIAGALVFTEIATGVLAIVLLVIASAMVLTSLFSFCGFYSIFGCTTCKTKK